jgi:hypothetical protein
MSSALNWAEPFWIKVMAKALTSKRRLTPAEKYRQLKKHTEDAGMTVTEKDGKIVVTRKRRTK